MKMISYNPIENPEEIRDDETKYMFLSRAKMDCESYIDDGPMKGIKYFVAGPTVAKQIEFMKKVYDLLPVKPDWCTLEQILEYEKEMLKIEGEKK